MTARQAWEYLLIELSKVEAPTMLLSDFNYFINKAINQYINKRYSIYDVTQQTTDDLRVLKSTDRLIPSENKSLYGDQVILPTDYLHILNCICEYTIKGNQGCFKDQDKVQYAAKKITADAWPIILNDYYNRPTPQRPYYYINNVNTEDKVPTSTLNEDTDTSKESSPRTINLKNIENKSVDKEAGVRYGNASEVICEIRHGNNPKFTLTAVIIEYLKVPQYIRLTQEQLNLVEDTSQILEFPDYVCQEIINELTLLVMENNSDPRLQSNNIVTKSIDAPAQQQAPQSVYRRRA